MIVAAQRAVAVAATLALVCIASCSTSRIGDYWEPPPPPPPSFESPDGGESDAGPAPDVPMCAVKTCSYPWANCPSSTFPCDVNLLNDNDNCGECGTRCKGKSPGNSTWTCVEGKCEFSCTGLATRDCDGNRDNGCEVAVLFDVNNCGSCGNVCPAGFECSDGICFDPCVVGNRPDICDGKCTNVKSDDRNCGECGNKCDPKDPTKPPLPSDMHYGCAGGMCGNPQCNSSTKRNCNDDVSDGCEVTIHTDAHCNGCDDACPAGKSCMYNGVWFCGCNDGETNCGVEGCKQLDDDPMHCGGCNRICPGYGRPRFTPSCSLGVCGGECAQPYADCDGIVSNGCEVNTRLDNGNCGGCGIACEEGQVCSEGRCLVAPCLPGEEPTTK
jgi:hypothetical protein